MSSFRNGLLLCTIPMLLAPGAQAQSNSCELLKQTLAARIPPEIKGYAMDDVPARTPVPSGGKVIGTCEGGARKVIYRRFGGAPLASDGGAAGSAPVAAAPAPSPAPPPPPPPPAASPRPAPVPPPAPTPAPKPASAPVAAVPKPAPAPPPAPVPPPPPVVRNAPAVAPVASAPAPAPVVALAKPTVVEKPAQPPFPATVSTTPPEDDRPGFFSSYGRWLWLLLALPLVAVAWAWVSHRMAYDKAGLPRGPRL